MKKRAMSVCIGLASCGLLGQGSLVQAQIPELLTYQGVLLDSTNVVVADSTYDLTFSIWDAPTGGIELWTSTRLLPVESGIFNVLLGDSTPLPASVFDGASRWLETTVSPQLAFSPRKRFSSVAYAYKALSTVGQPGAAQALGTAVPLSGTSLVTISSRTIACPTSGYVLVMGSAEIEVVAAIGGTVAQLVMGVSDSSGLLAPDQNKSIVVPDSFSTTSYIRGAAAQKIFSVSAGNKAFYLLGRRVSGGTHMATKSTLSLVFLPTAYGVVSTVASLGADGEFETTETVRIGRPDGMDGAITEETTGHLVELPELELKAARAESAEAKPNGVPNAAQPAVPVSEYEALQKRMHELERSVAALMIKTSRPAPSGSPARPKPELNP